MSGITGIFRRDGKDADPADIKKMNDKITHRGPDGSRVWCEGPVALGHQMLHTTPESLHEILPFEDKESGLVITADARIDNREDLAPKLGIEENEYVSDSYFILKAYEKWGERCPEELLGDFAFAIWDKNKETLFCARDHMGVKPFYYYLGEGGFYFATEIKALFTIHGVPHALNEEKLALHLMNTNPDNRLTFFKNVLSLKAAHKLTLNFRNHEINQYWKLDREYKIVLNSDEEYIQKFREIFTEAVNCRLRSAFSMGFELSGGLDTSSVVCMAQKIMERWKTIPDIDTYSLIFDDFPQVDERYYINKVVESCEEIKAHMISSDKISPLENINVILWHQEEPFYMVNMSLFWNLYNEMKLNDVRILLSGQGGDETIISHEKNYLKDLAREMKWKKLIIEIYGYSKRANINILNLFFYQVFIHFIPTFLLTFYNKVKFTRNEESNDFILNEDFAKKVGGKEYLEGFKFNSDLSNAKTAREFHYAILTNNPIQSSLEMIDRMPSAFSIEPRYPFFDKRLVEFCYAIPDDLKFRFGWNRYILRISMENILPKDIQWRPLKKFFDPVLERNLLLFEIKRLEKVFGDNPQLENFVNMNMLRNIYKKYCTGFETKYLYKIWNVLVVYLWLENAFFKKK